MSSQSEQYYRTRSSTKKERESKILQDHQDQKKKDREEKRLQILKNKHIKLFCYLLHRISDDNLIELQNALKKVLITKQQFPNHFENCTPFLKRRIIRLYNTRFNDFGVHCMFVLFEITI
jgi:hypothetical protein